MELPFLKISTFILSFYGVLAISLFIFKATDLGVLLLKKYHDA